MPSDNASLIKICGFIQTVQGCDVSDPENPRDVFFHILFNKDNQPIPPNSTQYPVEGAKFSGDGSGFIRSYFTDLALTPITGVAFKNCCSSSASSGGTGDGGTTTPDVSGLRTKQWLGGKVILTWWDRSDVALPTVDATNGLIRIEWRSSQIPVTGQLNLVAGDYNENELLFTNVGGKDSDQYSQSNDDSRYPLILPQNRVVLESTDPVEQEPHDRGDTFGAEGLPITTPGETTVRLRGLNGERGLYIRY